MSIEVTIEKLVYGGEGLGRVEGRVVLVPLVLPGERVSVDPLREDPRLVRASLRAVLEPSPERISPECAYFSRCGGCHYQHAPYEEQVKFKAAILTENLRRIGKLTDVPELETLTAAPWAYRNRVQFKTQKQGTRFEMGYFRAGSQQLLPVDLCPISSSAINAMIPVLKMLGARRDFPERPLELEILEAGGQVMMSVDGTPYFPGTLVSAFQEHIAGLESLSAAGRVHGQGHIFYDAAGFRFRVSHGVFFQVNRFLVETLAAAALEGLGGRVALDLYAGAGYFALPMAKRFENVMAVESHGAAVRDLKANLTAAAVENVEAVRGNTEDFLARTDLPPVDAVLADPPRAGLDKVAVARLADLNAPCIVYVSCDPATLARDLSGLTRAGYRLRRLLLVDLFPQTFHIEAVAFLEK